MKFMKYAVIVAGGSGTRMAAKTPKQYLELKGLPILMHTINAFFTYDASISIIIVLPQGDRSYWEILGASHRCRRGKQQI